MPLSELKKRTAKGLFWGGMSNTVQQLLNLIFGIVLARILSPDDYGMIGMLTIFSVIAGSIQDSGFSAALINREKGNENDTAWSSVFWFNIVVSAAIYLILFLCAPIIARFFRTPELTKLARFLFLGFFISSFGCVQSAYCAKHLMIKQKAIAIISAQIISGTAGIILATRGLAYWGLAAQTVIYIFCFQIMLWALSPWRPRFAFSFQPIAEMFPFSCKLLITNIFTNVNNNVFSVFLGRLYTKKEVGDYTQANKWATMGYSIVSGMVSNVSQPVLASINGDGERQLRIFRKLVRFTAFVSFPALFGLALIAPEFITIAITDKWIESANILRILCIGSAFIPISQLFASFMISRGKSDAYMCCTLSFSILQIAVLIALCRYGIHTMVIAYSVQNALWVFVWYLLIRHNTGYCFWSLLRDILPFLLTSTGVMAFTHLLTANIDSLYVQLACKVVIAALIYLLIMRIFDAEMLKETVGFFKERASLKEY